MTPPSARQIFEQSTLPRALREEVNVDLVNKARDIQKRFDIGDEDFRKIFRVAPQSQAKSKLLPGQPVYGYGYGNLPERDMFRGFMSRIGPTRMSKAELEPTQLALTSYGQKLFERADEIGKIRAESARIKAQPYGRVRARRTGLARG
jgi:hypothetical protein